MDPREEWLRTPVDLHYKGELAELGIRVTDAMEQEQIDTPKAIKERYAKRTS